MEEREIMLSNEVILFLKELTTTLFREEYFGFLETAEDYVNDLIDGTYSQLLGKNHYETPKELKYYGNYYVKVKGSKRTTWYVFFNKHETRYFIGFITNNHTPQGAHLNKL